MRSIEIWEFLLRQQTEINSCCVCASLDFLPFAKPGKDRIDCSPKQWCALF